MMERVSHLENGVPTYCLMMAYMLSARKMKWIKKLEDNLFELRSEFGTNIQRVLYFH